MARRLADGWSTTQVAAAFGVTPKTVRQVAGPATRRKAMPAWPTAPRGRTPARAGWAMPPWPRSWRCVAGACRDPAIARQLGRPVATVGLILRRHRLARLAALDPKPDDRPLPARAARRVDPHRHQEARQDRRLRAPDHRRPAWPEARHRLGLPACLHRRCVEARLHRDPARRAQGECRGVPRAGPRLVHHARRHRRAGDDRQRLGLSQPSPSAPPAKPPACSTSAPGPTRPRPTARPNGSSRPACANGPTCKPSRPPPPAPRPCDPGCTATTPSAPIQPSPQNRL